MKNIIYICFGFILFIIGCEEEKASSNNLLIDATFKNDWTNSTYKAFLLIQNLNGEVIADTSFTGNTNLRLLVEDGETIPERMIITTVTKTNDGYINVISNAGIRSGVRWVWDGLENENSLMFTSNISFLNMSDYERGVLSANGQYLKLDEFAGNYTFEHFGEDNSTEDILFMAYKDDGTGYYHILSEASIINNSFIIDGNNLNLAEYKLISNNTGEAADNVMLYAYDNQESFTSKNRHRLGTMDGVKVILMIMKTFIPIIHQNISILLHTFSGDWNARGQKQWLQKTHGEIPNSLEKINADFQLVDSNATSFRINSIGIYDNIAFKFDSQLGSGFSWYIYLNPDFQDTVISLPNLSAGVVESHPEFSSSQSSEISLILDKVSIYDYLCADNNDEWTDILFSDGYYGDICGGYRRLEYYVPQVTRE